VQGNLRPFISALNHGAGAIADLTIDHTFARAPVRLLLELAPLALAIEADGPGAIAHLRAGGAFSSEYVELGASAGARLQNYAGAGLSLASFLRLGTLDGLALHLGYGYVIKRNRYTGDVGAGLSNVTASLHVPVATRVRLYAEGGVSADRWIYAAVGLRHRLLGDGGPGTLLVSGSLGLAWVLDRPACPYPDTGWCTAAAWAAGPTLGLGIERRF
jgi:hypothetical protein